MVFDNLMSLLIITIYFFKQLFFFQRNIYQILKGKSIYKRFDGQVFVFKQSAGSYYIFGQVDLNQMMTRSGFPETTFLEVNDFFPSFCKTRHQYSTTTTRTTQEII